MCGRGGFGKLQTRDCVPSCQQCQHWHSGHWPPATCYQPRIVILQQDWHQENVNKDPEAAFFEYLATFNKYC